MSSLTRRDFLEVTGAILGAVMLNWPSQAGAATLDLQVLPDQIGTLYLALFPAENQRDVLQQVLHFRDAQKSQDELKQALLSDMHLDYEWGQTFRFGGWLLSRTEGRLCALKSLNGKI